MNTSLKYLILTIILEGLLEIVSFHGLVKRDLNKITGE